MSIEVQQIEKSRMVDNYHPALFDLVNGQSSSTSILQPFSSRPQNLHPHQQVLTNP